MGEAGPLEYRQWSEWEGVELLWIMDNGSKWKGIGSTRIVNSGNGVGGGSGPLECTLGVSGKRSRSLGEWTVGVDRKELSIGINHHFLYLFLAGFQRWGVVTPGRE